MTFRKLFLAAIVSAVAMTSAVPSTVFAGDRNDALTVTFPSDIKREHRALKRERKKARKAAAAAQKQISEPQTAASPAMLFSFPNTGDNLR